MAKRKFTPEFKTQVVLGLLSERMSTAQACQRYQIKQQTVSHWKTQFLQKAPQIFANSNSQDNGDQERIGELERMVGRLTMELEILKKVSIHWNSI